ncbi:MAG: HAD family hydrolase [Campylobacterales bacterium]|nr:HAD family hydrolase [Campylobacterales bacterium]
MRVKVIVFDLDDTLYNEINYVISGFKAVSSYLSKEFAIDETRFYEKMIHFLESQGRGKVFDETLKFFGLYSKTNVKKSISIYRTHSPKIYLNQDSKKILEYYFSYNVPLYLVTDGNKIVQYNKIKALEIENYFKKIFITHRYGIKHAKPSPYCFKIIANLEKVHFNEIVYIGDNINKDFISIKKLGFRTIHLLNGMFKDIKKSQKYHAEITISKIQELYDILQIVRRNHE